VAPDYCALNSNEVKEGLQEGSRERLENLVVTVLDTARRLQAQPSVTDDVALP
jgi:hypothetical protein